MVRFWTWLLARLLVAAVLVGYVYSALLLPSSGEKEFRRTLDALSRVNSIHYSMVAAEPSQHTEEEADLVCSDDSFHRATRIVVHNSEKDFNLNTEILRAAGQVYRSQGDGLWKHDSSSLETTAMTCRRLAQHAGVWIVPDIGQMLEHSIIEKGQKKTVNGDLCRDWRVTFRSGPLLEHRTLCIGVNDHLPREMVANANSARWTYTFNSPTTIDPPTNIVPEPERDTYRPPPPGLSLEDAKDAN